MSVFKWLCIVVLLSVLVQYYADFKNMRRFLSVDKRYRDNELIWMTIGNFVVNGLVFYIVALAMFKL